MATYLCNKLKAFKAPGDPSNLPLSTRSSFRMKSYDSATDPRAWAIEAKDRQQYIMELFTAQNCDNKPYQGKFVDMHTLMRTLMSNKDMDIRSLQSQLSRLIAFVDELDLNDQQRETLQNLQRIGSTCVWATNSNLTRSLSVDLIELSRNEAIDDLQKKFQEQDEEIQFQKSIVSNTLDRLTTLQMLVGEVDDLKQENADLRTLLDCMENERNSGDNEIFLRTKINDLGKQIFKLESRKKNNLKRTQCFHVSIMSVEKQETAACTYEPYVDARNSCQEGNSHERTVADLLMNIDAMQEVHTISGEQNCNHWCGDNASQLCQTQSEAPVELEMRTEIKYLREKLCQYQVQRLDYDRMCLRISELQFIEKEHSDMKAKYDLKLLEQRTCITQKLNEIDMLNERCACLRIEIEGFKKYQHENDLLADKCKQLQAVVDSQQGNERMLEDARLLVAESECRINELRAELKNRSKVIQVSEDKLVALQSQLRDSINTLSSETSELQGKLQVANARVEELTQRQIDDAAVIAQLRTELITGDVQTRRCAKNLLDHHGGVIMQLRSNLLDLQHDNDRISQMSYRLQAFVAHRRMASASDSCSASAHHLAINKCTVSDPQVITLIRQLSGDTQQAIDNHCDPDYSRMLQARFKEIQTLAKKQVHWMADELRKCKAQVLSLQCTTQN